MRAPLILPLAAACALAGFPAGAGAYSIVRSGPDMVTVVDPAAVEKLDGAVRRASSITVQKNLITGGPQQPGYVKTLNEYDCDAQTARWRNFSVYSRFGKLVLHKDNDDLAWKPVAKDPELRVAFRLICDHVDSGEVFTASSIGSVVLALMQSWDDTAELPPLQTPQAAPPPTPRKAAKPKRRSAGKP